MKNENVFMKLLREDRGFQTGIMMVLSGIVIVVVATVFFKGVTASWKKILCLIGIGLSFAGTELLSKYVAAISSEVHRRKSTK